MPVANECPRCFAPRPRGNASYCPQCGQPFASPHVVHIERRPTLWTLSVVAGIVLTVLGGFMATGEDSLVVGLTLLAMGVAILLVGTVRSLSRRH